MTDKLKEALDRFSARINDDGIDAGGVKEFIADFAVIEQAARKHEKLVPLLRQQVKWLYGVAEMIDDRNPDGGLKEVSDPLRIKALQIEKQIAEIMEGGGE